MYAFEVIEAQREPLRSKLKDLLRHFPKEEHLTVRAMRAGTTFIREGDAAQTVFILLSGCCSSYWIVPSKVQYRCSHKEALTFIGDLAALSDFPFYTASVKADASSVFLVVYKDTFLQWIEKDVELYRRLVKYNLQMLLSQGLSHRIADRRDTYVRILDYLNWNVGQQSHSRNQSFVTIRKTRETIAEEMGDISLRTLNRYLSILEKEGIISLVRGKIQISPEQKARIERFIREFDFLKSMPNDLF